jgi:riboflavin synthase
MFTGIIESLGKITAVETHGTNKSYWLVSNISHELKIDQSLSHNGVCLTVEAIGEDNYKVTAIEETLKKTNLATWNIDDEINLERCMQMNGRIDGHLVQGHVDATAICIGKKTLDGSWEFTFEFDKKFASLLIEKGSVCINGTSLTAFNVGENTFTVAIIPYTFEHTNFKHLSPQMLVNIEFDMIGKYLRRFASIGI